MSTTTPTDLRAVKPLTRAEAVALGRIDYQRFVTAVAGLSEADWQHPTDCEGWTVRDLVGHLAGAMTTATGLRRVVGEQLAVLRRSRRTGESQVDAMTAIQVEAMAEVPTDQLVERMRQLVEPAARGRARVPGLVARAVRVPVDLGYARERWSLDFLLGTILTRDTWLHRVADLARAVGGEPELDADHDGRIVADVAAEWARRHGQPVRLELTGAAGGSYVAGDGGPELSVDAVELCRMVSGRAEPTHELSAARVPF